MIEIFYNYALFAAWILLFFFGTDLLTIIIPKTTTYRYYNRSRKILGVALLLFGVQILLQWVFDFRSEMPWIAASLNLSCYYLEAILFGMSFISLLDPQYINRRQMLRDFVPWIASVAFIWCAVHLSEGKIRLALLVIGAVIFFANAVRISLAFFKAYRTAGQRTDSYSAENLGQFVRWLRKSTYGIIFFGLSGSILAFAPRQGNAIYMFAGIFMFIYIYISFRNYSVHFKEVVTAVDEGTKLLQETADMVTEQPQEKSNTKARLLKDEEIARRLEQWITSGGYRQTGITVSLVASVTNTNRTYLSIYINDRFGCNFREWIVSLRIREAKSLLAERSDLTIEQIAGMTGFSSDSYFSKQFTLAEGISPSKWRKSQAWIK